MTGRLLLTAIVLAAIVALPAWWLASPGSSPSEDKLNAVSLNPAPASEAPARTDRGRAVVLYRAQFRAPTSETLAARAAVERRLKLVVTGPRDEVCNCHGWVFTDGRYWLQSADVEIILRDNGYNTVTDPQVGDIAVYHSANGAIQHTGLVRSTGGGGEVMVESRWGEMGRYLHRVADQVFAAHCTFVRSPRQGHLLAGLN